MNPKVKELLDKKKEEVREKELQRRNEHLISLGFIDESNVGKIYVKTQIAGSKLDVETNQYYIKKDNAINVTDEEYKEICKYFPEQSYNRETQQINNSYKEPSQIKYENPIPQDYRGDITQLKEYVKTIKSWVKFWSILSIVLAVIAVIGALSSI